MRILLLEDEKADYLIIKHALSKFKSITDYELLWADTIDAALEKSKDHKIDIYLIDYSLKTGSGLDFVEKLQKDTPQKIPFIFITGYDSSDLFEKSINYKFFDYILKDEITASLLERAIIFAIDRQEKELAILEQSETKAQKAKMESLGHLAGGMAHELNNLIHPVLLQSEMLNLKEEKEIDPRKLGNYLEVINRNLNAAAKVIDSIMVFATSWSNPEDNKAVDILPFIKETIEKYQIKSHNNIDILTRADIDEAFLRIEPLILVQVINELLSNAEKAMQDCNKQRIEIVLSNNLKNSQFNLKIIDKGNGIDEKDLPHIFNPFFTTSKIGMGKGLGLATVYKIIEAWNGQITIQNNDDKGITVEIILPFAEEQKREQNLSSDQISESKALKMSSQS